MMVVVWVLALLVAAAALLLVVPVRVGVELHVGADETPRVEAEARWLFLTWRPGTARQTRRARRRQPSAAPPLSPAPPVPRRRRARRRQLLAVIRTPGFPKRVGRLAADVLRTLRPRHVDARFTFGFDDPMATGIVFGASQAVSGLTGAFGWPIRLDPEFAGPALAGDARVAWAVRPAAMLWPVVTFVASPVTWRAAHAGWRAGRRQSPVRQ